MSTELIDVLGYDDIELVSQIMPKREVFHREVRMTAPYQLRPRSLLGQRWKIGLLFYR